MIEHNSLQDRLNAVKSGKPIPKPPMPKLKPAPSMIQQGPTVLTYRQFFVNEGYKLFNVISASILYGFGLNAIFRADWDFLGILGVGFLLNHGLTILMKSKLFKK